MAKVTTNTVSGSAISFNLYRNNVPEVNRLAYEGTTIQLNPKYYNITYNGDNTSVLEFTNEFVQEFNMI